MNEQESKHQHPTILRPCLSVCVCVSLIFCTSINFKLPLPSLMVICSCRFGYFGLLTRFFLLLLLFSISFFFLLCWYCSFVWVSSSMFEVDSTPHHFPLSTKWKNDVAIFSINNNKRAEFTRNRVNQQRISFVFFLRNKVNQTYTQIQTCSNNYIAKTWTKYNIDTKHNSTIQNAHVRNIQL